MITGAAGSMRLVYDLTANWLYYDFELKNLNGWTMAHLHAVSPGSKANCTGGSVVFWLYPTNAAASGLSSPAQDWDYARLGKNITNPVFPGTLGITSIETLALALREKRIYANLHTTANPAGEICGSY